MSGSSETVNYRISNMAVQKKKKFVNNITTIVVKCIGKTDWRKVWRYTKMGEKNMYRRQTIWPEETEQTMIYKTLHRKQKICAIWTSLKPGVNTGAPEGLVVPTILVGVTSCCC
jgi:hypothetical protein